MANILIINGHQPYPGSPGRLNAAFADRATRWFAAEGHTTRDLATSDPWDTEEQVANQIWADLIVLQFPLNSMSVPWRLKQYLDEVYTAGMDGRLAKGDGRSRKDPSLQYGSGGKMQGTRYMLSVTSNAPPAAFNDPDQFLFEGRSLDQLLAPLHINFTFFAMQQVATFSAYDVSKNPTINEDFERFDAHLADVAKTLKS